MTITNRAYAGADDIHKMQAMTAQAVAEAGYCGYLHVGDIPHRIFNNSRWYDPAELVRLWEDDAGQLLGWATVYPRYRGFDLQTTPNLRGSDLHREILAWAVDQTRVWMAKTGEASDIATDLNGEDFPTAEILEEAGFQRGRQWINLTLRSLDDPIPEPHLPNGFIVRSAEGIHEADKLADVHSKSFGSSWTPEMYRAVQESPGFVIENEIVVVAPDGRFAAFTVTWFDDVNKVALFEPVGTHEDFRRMGLARNMMLYAMRRMRHKGMQQAMVAHETDNPASTNLYASVGFTLAHKVYEYTLAP